MTRRQELARNHAVYLMSDLNQRIKAEAEPGVFEVIRWANMVHEDTMKRLGTDLSVTDQLAPQKFNLYEREEARKILLEYGAGKPTRIVEHRGSKKHPIAFNTTVVPSGSAKQLTEPAFIEAEVVTYDRPVNP